MATWILTDVIIRHVAPTGSKLVGFNTVELYLCNCLGLINVSNNSAVINWWTTYTVITTENMDLKERKTMPSCGSPVILHWVMWKWFWRYFKGLPTLIDHIFYDMFSTLIWMPILCNKYWITVYGSWKTGKTIEHVTSFYLNLSNVFIGFLASVTEDDLFLFFFFPEEGIVPQCLFQHCLTKKSSLMIMNISSFNIFFNSCF